MWVYFSSAAAVLGENENVSYEKTPPLTPPIIHRSDPVQSSQPWHQWPWETRWPEQRSLTFLKKNGSGEFWLAAWSSSSWWVSWSLTLKFPDLKSSVSADCDVMELNLYLTGPYTWGFGRDVNDSNKRHNSCVVSSHLVLQWYFAGEPDSINKSNSDVTKQYSCLWKVAVSWSSCVQIVVVLMFVIGIILYRTILSIIIYKSEHSFLTFSVSTTKNN